MEGVQRQMGVIDQLSSSVESLACRGQEGIEAGRFCDCHTCPPSVDWLSTEKQ